MLKFPHRRSQLLCMTLATLSTWGTSSKTAEFSPGPEQDVPLYPSWQAQVDTAAQSWNDLPACRTPSEHEEAQDQTSLSSPCRALTPSTTLSPHTHSLISASSVAEHKRGRTVPRRLCLPCCPEQSFWSRFSPGTCWFHLARCGWECPWNNEDEGRNVACVWKQDVDRRVCGTGRL